MNSYAAKTTANRSQIMTNDRAKSRKASENTSKFTDNRSETAMLKKLQQLSDSSQNTTQLKALRTGPTSNVIQMIGEFVGVKKRHHMHVGTGVHHPHYRDGNGKTYNIGYQENYDKERMEEVIELIKGRTDEEGVQACIDWCKTECKKIITDAGGRANLRNGE